MDIIKAVVICAIASEMGKKKKPCDEAIRWEEERAALAAAADRRERRQFYITTASVAVVLAVMTALVAVIR